MSAIITRPANSSFSEADWTALSSMWHAVAYSDEVSMEEPYGTTLLDVNLVLYRTEEGLTVALDRCPHRGASLSRGAMEDGGVTCPYHALKFGAGGACTAIPAHPEMTIPSKMCLTTFKVVERFNIIWTCFDPEPINPMPLWEELEDPDNETLRVLGPEWPLAAALHCENFHDPAHFGVVHVGTFGSGDNKEAPIFKVNREKFTMTHENTFQQVERNAFDVDTSVVSAMTFSYHFTFPFNNWVRVSSDSSSFKWYSVYDVAQPITATNSRIFLQIVRERRDDHDQTLEEILEFQKAIVAEDLRVVSHLDPLELNLGLANQVLMPCDRWSVAYRRGLKDLGLRTGIGTEI